MQISSFPNSICWRGCFASIICFWHFCQISSECSCMDSYLGLLFCSTGFHICFCASTMLFLLLWLCSIVWSWVLWYLQHCSFHSVLPWLLVVFCVSKWNLGLFFQSPIAMCRAFMPGGVAIFLQTSSFLCTFFSYVHLKAQQHKKIQFEILLSENVFLLIFLLLKKFPF
jgi:hypothetical protein